MYVLADTLVLLAGLRAAALCRRARRWAREDREAEQFIADLRAVA